jgi:hypothetical protein
MVTFLGGESIEKDFLLDKLQNLECAQAIQQFDLFLDIMNFITDKVFLALKDLPFQESVDWELLKQKVKEIKHKGNFACGILRDEAGVFKVFEDREAKLRLSNLDNMSENEVLFLDKSSGFGILKQVTWDFF